MKISLFIIFLSFTLSSIAQINTAFSFQYLETKLAISGYENLTIEANADAFRNTPDDKSRFHDIIISIKNIDPQPQICGYAIMKTFGNIGGKVYVISSQSFKWEYLFIIPAEKNPHLSIVSDDKLFYHRSDDSLFYYDLTGKEIKRESSETVINRFFKERSKELKFAQGVSGCFSSSHNELSYTSHAGDFDDPVETSGGNKHRGVMPLNDDAIAGVTVSAFLKNIRSLFNKTESPLTNLEDLGFTEADYKRCKRHILAVQKSRAGSEYQQTSFEFDEKNIDFDRLLRLVDSIKELDQNQFQKALIPSFEIISTTVRSKRVIFTNSRNETLSISNYYCDKNLSFRWTIKLNDITITTNWYGINKFLKEAYPDFLPQTDKSLLLYDFVKNLYWSNGS